MKKILVLCIILALFFITFFITSCNVCNETFDTCDYSIRPPKCAETFEEAKSFCNSLGSDCKVIGGSGSYRCSCPSECSQL